MPDKVDKAKDEANGYAVRHPRRMYGSFFALGTVLGASMVAAKKNHDKNALQKFMDQITR